MGAPLGHIFYISLYKGKHDKNSEYDQEIPQSQTAVKITTNQQQQNHRLQTDSSQSQWGLKCILLVPNPCPRSAVVEANNIKLAWRIPNYSNISS